MAIVKLYIKNNIDSIEVFLNDERMPLMVDYKCRSFYELNLTKCENILKIYNNRGEITYYRGSALHIVNFLESVLLRRPLTEHGFPGDFIRPTQLYSTYINVEYMLSSNTDGEIIIHLPTSNNKILMETKNCKCIELHNEIFRDLNEEKRQFKSLWMPRMLLFLLAILYLFFSVGLKGSIYIVVFLCVILLICFIMYNVL